MKKTLLATLVASLGTAVGPPVHAEPGVMIGISHNFGGSTGVTLKLLSTRQKDKAALAAGITYFPWATGSPWGADVGLGYTFNRGALTFGYDWLNGQFQLSVGAANTKSSPAPAPAPAPQPTQAPAPAPAVAAAEAPAAAPAPAPAPAPAAAEDPCAVKATVPVSCARG